MYIYIHSKEVKFGAFPIFCSDKSKRVHLYNFSILSFCICASLTLHIFANPKQENDKWNLCMINSNIMKASIGFLNNVQPDSQTPYNYLCKLSWYCEYQ